MSNQLKIQLGALAVLASVLCPSCSWVGLHTSGHLREATAKAYRQGEQSGASREARRAYLEAQREAERPEAPPVIVYHEVPVEAHVSEDGVKIEAHTVTVPVIKN